MGKYILCIEKDRVIIDKDLEMYILLILYYIN